MAAKAGPGDAKNSFDPSAIVGTLAVIERQHRESDARSEDEGLAPLNLEPLARTR
jgi:hypothetical protein